MIEPVHVPAATQSVPGQSQPENPKIHASVSPGHTQSPGAGRRPGSTTLNRARLLLRVCFIFPLLVAGLGALTLDQLLSDPKMSPKKFAGLFDGFSFETHPFDVQDPEVFLSTRTGDCIDYAVLADYVLKRNGYDTRLIRVEMVGKNMGHAVCYVTQDRIYMDYNNRRYFLSLVRSGPSIREIATKVAASFDAHWTFASEFTYDYNTSNKKVVLTVVQTDPASMDPDAARYGSSRPKPNS
jgi:hypothetical protein